MIRVLVCWEDRYHETLDLCLRRARQSMGRDPPERRLFFDDARGNGGFGRFVERDWPRLFNKGRANSGGPIHYLLCVADADRASDCCGEKPVPPSANSAAWVRRCNEVWTERLRASTAIAPARIHGRFLRWSKESLVVAGHDVAVAMRRLGCRDAEAMRRHLETCIPSPLTIDDADFAEQFRRPTRCLEELVRASGGLPPGKSERALDDVLKEISGTAIERLRTRVPDLEQLAILVDGLPVPNLL